MSNTETIKEREKTDFLDLLMLMRGGQVRFKYTETTKASVGASQLAVPEDFRITLPVFVGGESVPLDALLRFRTPQGKLTIWYTLVRPEDAIRAGFAKIRHHISKELGLVVINGSPSA